MALDRAILCGDVRDKSLPCGDPEPLRLRLRGVDCNVHLRIEDVRLPMCKTVPPLLLDLIDIAAYVYCADQAVSRCNGGIVDAEEIGLNWRRRLFFRVEVRVPDFWRSACVQEQLVSTLSFLSEDSYHFDFVPMKKVASSDGYLDFQTAPHEGALEEVVLFSGGLDSLAGAVQEAVVDRRKVLLVNHRSTGKLSALHRRLLDQLTTHAGDRRPLHIPVRVNKEKGLTREFTQRSRSFLCASLGAVIARMVGQNRIRFYENGVVGLNLPPSAQVVGARATRTTHPQVLNGFASLFSCVTEAPFVVENPFLWKTKTEVVRLIGEAGCGDLIEASRSCASTWTMTREHDHCGVCSQCIDRRFSVLAAGQESHDPSGRYRVDLILGERDEGASSTMLAAYLETANQVGEMQPLEFFGRFGEASRVIRQFAGRADETAERIFGLYQRHARQVVSVVDEAIAANATAIRTRNLPSCSLLQMVCDTGEPSVAALAPEEQPAVASAKPVNYIRRKDSVWEIRFEGQEARHYPPEVGFEYLHELFQKPGTSFTVAQLDCVVNRRRRVEAARTSSRDELEGVVAAVSGGRGDEILDEQGLLSLEARLGEIDELLARLRESDSATRLDDIEELEKERSTLAETVRKALGLGRRKRTLPNEGNRIRNRVCNAIRRAWKQIHKYDPVLAKHLAKPVLTFGYNVSYHPDSEVRWSILAEACVENRMLHEK